MPAAYENPPAPWKGPYFLHVGGVCATGFAPERDLLLVLSHSGSGLFDPMTRERLARANEPLYDYDEATETAPGIGPLAGANIPLCGLRGAIRTRRRPTAQTADGWRVTWTEIEERLCAPDEPVVLIPPPGVSTEGKRIGTFETIYSIGFSPSGLVLIVAESHTITVFTRHPVPG